MRVATVDGLVTLFYDGSKPLWNEQLDQEWQDEVDNHDEWYLAHNMHQGETREHWENWPLSLDCKRYIKERFSWQQVIILEGVTEIPEGTFARCYHVKRVVFSNTVIRIRYHAFYECVGLVFVKLSMNLEFIGRGAFCHCNLLRSIFIPPRCRNIGTAAFFANKSLEILSVSQDTVLRTNSITGTKLLQNSPFKEHFHGPSTAARRHYNHLIHTWLKTINDDEEFELHRVCSSFEPKLEMILKIMKERGGPKAFKVQNRIWDYSIKIPEGKPCIR